MRPACGNAAAVDNLPVAHRRLGRPTLRSGLPTFPQALRRGGSAGLN